MHMLMVIGGGVVLLGVFMLFGKLWGELAGVVVAANIFIPVWLAVSIANLWIGVTHAGYSMREEIPILLVVFAIPAVIATLSIWYLWRGG